jgi:hypothetical protein
MERGKGPVSAQVGATRWGHAAGRVHVGEGDSLAEPAFNAKPDEARRGLRHHDGALLRRPTEVEEEGGSVMLLDRHAVAAVAPVRLFHHRAGRRVDVAPSSNRADADRDLLKAARSELGNARALGFALAGLAVAEAEPVTARATPPTRRCWWRRCLPGLAVRHAVRVRHASRLTGCQRATRRQHHDHHQNSHDPTVTRGSPPR